MRVIVMRRPVLMEDEGMHSLVKICASQKEAEDWIAAQADEYFKTQDYYIVAARTTGGGK